MGVAQESVVFTGQSKQLHTLIALNILGCAARKDLRLEQVFVDISIL
jgi:hypothetical protein